MEIISLDDIKEQQNNKRLIVIASLSLLLLLAVFSYFYFNKKSPHRCIPESAILTLNFPLSTPPALDSALTLSSYTTTLHMIQSIATDSSMELIAALVPTGVQSDHWLFISSATILPNELIFEDSRQNSWGTIYTKDGVSYITYEGFTLFSTSNFLIENSLSQMGQSESAFLPNKTKFNIHTTNLSKPFLRAFGQSTMASIFKNDLLLAGDWSSNDTLLRSTFSFNALPNIQHNISPHKVLSIAPQETALCYASPMQFDELSPDVLAFYNKWFAAWHSGMYACILTPSFDMELQDNALLAFHVQSIEKAIQTLELQSKTVERYNNYSILEVELFGKGGFSLSQFAFNKNAFDWHPKYFVEIDEWLVFSEDVALLKKMVDWQLFGQTLLQSKTTTASIAQLGQVDAIALGQLAYWDVLFKKRNWNLPAYYYQHGQITLGLDLKKGKGELLANNGAVKRRASLHWKTTLPSKGIGVPAVLSDPESQQTYILQQTDDFKLYAFDKKGKLRWKKALSSPIISDIWLVDREEQATSYIIFHTEKEIFQLDLSGLDVGNFPIRLTAAAQKNSQLILLGEQLGHCLLFTADNGNAYLYDMEGLPISGWNPKQFPNFKLKHVQYNFVNGQDMFLFETDRNTCFIENLKKENLLFEHPLDSNYLSPIYMESALPPYRAMAATPEGRIQVISMEGISFGLNAALNGPILHYQLADVVGDNRQDIIVATKNQIAVFYYTVDNTFIKGFEYYLKEDIQCLKTTGIKGKSKQWMACNTQSGLSYLFDVYESQPIGGSPWAGGSAFQLKDWLDSETHFVVTVDGNQLNCFSSLVQQ